MRGRVDTRPRASHGVAFANGVAICSVAWHHRSSDRTLTTIVFTELARRVSANPVTNRATSAGVNAPIRSGSSPQAVDRNSRAFHT